jgi:hypothetical protein
MSNLLQGFWSYAAAKFFNESGKGLSFLEGSNTGLAWYAWDNCCLAVWDGTKGEWRRE